jgi:tRNA-specific 2-thiouridylase
MLALSGGVDSSACIELLRRDGYAVSGCVLAFSPAHAGAVRAAQQVARAAGIPLVVQHGEALFEEVVVEPFCRTYAEGRTPSPCPVCNPLVKFKTLARMADAAGIHWLASGHYAQVCEVAGVFHVRRAKSAARDQSYMLYRLPQALLKRLVLPAGALEKDDLRRLAAAEGLPSADAPDSQEICFIPDGDYASFIERRGYAGAAGRFVGPHGEDLGPHRGLIHYTVGQRRGLGLALGQPVFVKRLEPGGNVVLGYEADLLAQGVTINDVVTSGGQALAAGRDYEVKIRSRAKPARCRVKPNGNGYTVSFETPQRAPAPGQHAVLYDGELVVGGGVIDEVMA